jgi:RecG-like helicase
MGWLRRAFDRFRIDAETHRLQSVREWVESQPGVTLISEVEPRSVARVGGVVDALRVRPRGGVPQIEAQLSDGTGSVTAIWLGRRSIPGLALGVRMLVEGRVGSRKGALEILNPTFEFGHRPGSEH